MPVPDISKPAWTLFEVMLMTYGYPILPGSFWTYVVRKQKGSLLPSLHSYGIAGDKDPGLNRFILSARWSDTLFSPDLVDALLAIRTMNGKQVFAWGGQWNIRQDLMHWYLTCKPADLETGIDYTTVTVGLTQEEITFVKDLKRAVDELGSNAFGAMKHSILNVRRHRSGGDLAPQAGPKGEQGEQGPPGVTPTLSDYHLERNV